MRLYRVAVIAMPIVLVAGCSSTKNSKATAPASSVPTTTATTAPSTEPPTTSGYVPLQVAAPSEAPICQQAATSTNPADLVAAFRAARLQGRDAEGCLSASAYATYDDAHCDETALASSPGPIVLYRCGTHRVSAIPDATIEAERADGQAIQIEVDLDGTDTSGQPNRLVEHLRIGPGTPIGSHASAAQVIVSVDNM